MKIKAVIFDFDQVIINSYVDHLIAFAIAAMKFRIIIDPKALYVRFGKSAKDILHELKPSMSDAEIKKYVHEKEKIYRKLAERRGFKLMPGVRQTLHFLSKKKIKCAIASSAVRKNILLAAKKTKIKKYFSAIVAAEDVKRHKPYPDPLLKAAKLLHVKPKECIYVGDSIFEMIAAKRARMFAVGIHTGIYSERELFKNGAKKVIRNMAELKKILK